MMGYESIVERNLSEGVQVVFLSVNDNSGGLFIRTVLVVIWLIVCFRIYLRNKNVFGNGDIAQSLAVASFVTTIFAVILNLIPNLLDVWSIIVCVVLTVFSGLFLLLSKDSQ